MGRPDHGEGSLEGVLREFRQEQLAAEGQMQALMAPEGPHVSMPNLPPAVANDPLLALAMLLGILQKLVLWIKLGADDGAPEKK